MKTPKAVQPENIIQVIDWSFDTTGRVKCTKVRLVRKKNVKR